ncbi:MAG TPA: hypothetical protein VJ729_14565 [Nitrososphaeraceae archaeon]|nr:hypothetical protein [Nitrososphaeraceae archaeon]
MGRIGFIPTLLLLETFYIIGIGKRENCIHRKTYGRKGTAINNPIAENHHIGEKM